MSSPTLYLETTIPSYLVARRSPLARIAADQQTTQDWWDFHRHEYEIFVSEAVLDEAGDGDPALAIQRMAILAGLPRLQITPEVDALVERLLRNDIIPAKAAADAVHLALSAAHGIEYLLNMELSAHPQSETRTPHRSRM
jgi:predicted nucleic acid-binding protein